MNNTWCSKPTLLATWLTLLLVGCSSSTKTADEEADSSTSIAARDTVIALGKLMPQSGVVNIGATPGDRIDQLNVDIGSDVNSGDILLVLASKGVREQELGLANARLADAQKQKEIQEDLAAQQIEIAKASKADNQAFLAEKSSAENLIAVQREQLALARRQLDDLRALFESDANADQELVRQSEVDSAEVQVALALAELQQAESRLVIAEEKQRVANNTVGAGIRAAESQKAAASETPLASLEAAIALAEENVSLSTITSPIGGTVINLFSHQGDMVGNQPVMRIADLTKMICIAEVYESQLALIDPAKQQVAEITSPALYDPQSGTPITLTGTVYRRSALIGQATLIDPNPLAPQDRRTAEVYIQLDDTSAQIARRFVQLQVQVRIRVGGAAGE